MADITMCSQGLCPNASICYRTKAIPSTHQATQVFEYIVKCTRVICEFFIPLPENKDTKL